MFEVCYNGTIVYHTSYGQELSAPFSLNFNASRPITVVANETVKASNVAANISENATQRIIKPPKPQKNSIPAEIRTALIMVGIIIAIIVIFFAVRGREMDFAEKTGPAELR